MKNLQWTKEGGHYLLKNKEEVFINLNHTPSKSATFSINNRYYSISLKGFWAPRYVVSYEGENILELAYSLWKTSGNIKCSDGSTYQLKYESKNGFKMRFLDGESEILSYAMDYKDLKNLKMSFYIGTVMEDAEKLLRLAALGMSIFLSHIGEMTSADDLLLLIM